MHLENICSSVEIWFDLSNMMFDVSSLIVR